MKTLLAAAVAVVIGIFVLTSIAHQGNVSATPHQRDANVVFLVAAPGQSVVQMFDRIGGGKVTIFPNHQECYRFSGPESVTEAGVTMQFDRLKCDGTLGYVNHKWVR